MRKRHAAPTERSFGRSFGLVGAAAAAFSWWRGHNAAAVALLVVAMLLLAAATWMPRALRIPNLLWWRVAQVLGRINARVLLTLAFFVVITPIGAVRRLVGSHPLAAPPQGGWLPYPTGRRDPKHYEHLF